MKKTFLKFIQFSELSRQINNKKLLLISTTLKAIVVVAIFSIIFFIQEEPTSTQHFFIIFDLSVLLLSVLLGLTLTSVKFLFSDFVAVLYAVVIRIWLMITIFYLVIDTLMRTLLNSRASFSFDHVEAHLLIVVLVMILVPNAFLVMDKEKQIS